MMDLTTHQLLREIIDLLKQPVDCRHEPYQGRCAHCDVPFRDGKPEPRP